MAREVQLMQSIDHPRLVKLHKVVDTEHVLYLVVEQASHSTPNVCTAGPARAITSNMYLVWG